MAHRLGSPYHLVSTVALAALLVGFAPGVWLRSSPVPSIVSPTRPPMSLYAPVVSTLGLLTLVAAAAGLGLLATLSAPAGRRWAERTFAHHRRHPIAWAWLVAALAMSGSLFLSDVVGLLPCLFCWYQRIAMYPLVLVLGVAVLRGDAGVWRYALPLVVVGFALSAYHVALQWNPNLEVVSCNVGAPCSGRYLAVFGFISIPVMAGGAFLLIGALLLVLRVVDRADA